MTAPHAADLLVDELRRSWPVAEPVALSPAQRERLGRVIRADLVTEQRRQHRREDRRRRLSTVSGPTLLMACLVAVATLVLLAVTGARPDPVAPAARPAVADPAAVRLLDRISTVALRTPGTTVGADQFVYVRSAVLSNEGLLGGPVELGALHEREIWLGQDPSPARSDGSLIREFGQDWPLDAGSPTPAGIRRPTYAWLASLPADPDELLTGLRGELTPSAAQEPHQALFETIGSLVGEAVLPPRTAASLFRAVTRIPGVTVERDVTDAIGRAGIGVAREDTVFDTRSVWVFDPITLDLLGTRGYFTSDTGGDTLASATAVLERTVVDSAGKSPGPVA